MTRTSARRPELRLLVGALIAGVLTVLAVAGLSGCVSAVSADERPGRPSAAGTAVSTTTRIQVPADAGPSDLTVVASLLSAVHVVSVAPQHPGYDRSCRRGHGCVFGPAWSDDTAAPDAHDGCDTRNNVLAEQLSNPEFKPGTRRCVVISGVLNDPYTGRMIAFTKAATSLVQIDHVYPLSRAWNFGAWTWTAQQRATFANDTEVNLLAVDAASNQAKSDSGLSEWMPTNPAWRCRYAVKYLTVASRYKLAITAADRDTAVRACSVAGSIR